MVIGDATRAIEIEIAVIQLRDLICEISNAMRFACIDRPIHYRRRREQTIVIAIRFACLLASVSSRAALTAAAVLAVGARMK